MYYVLGHTVCSQSSSADCTITPVASRTSYGGVQVSNTVASQPASSLLPVLLQRSSMVTFDEGSPLHDGVEHTDSGYLLTHSLTH